MSIDVWNGWVHPAASGTVRRESTEPGSAQAWGSDVLIVEDQGLVRAGMRSLLEKAAPRSRIHEESSYEGARARLDGTAFAFVFIDIDLGGAQTGMDLLQYVREREMPCRAIMLSGDDDRSTVLACIAKGASGYITKAVGDAGVFEQAIRTVLNDGVYLPASMAQRAPGSRLADAPRGGTAESVGLAPRHYEVLYYLCQGLPNKSIANRMGISEGTVRKSYVSDLLRFFGVVRRTELIVEVARRRLKVPPPR
ncbi:response regulator [Acidovorax sacchari]|uniref:response regulator n=1 Tax=Acidovorax sacchari TaxID=3230736 RepID=UPI0039E5F427